MKFVGTWAIALLVAAAGGYLVGEIAGSGVAAIATFFCLLMVAWCVIYRPWTL
jgi:hypothetical protein